MMIRLPVETRPSPRPRLLPSGGDRQRRLARMHRSCPTWSSKSTPTRSTIAASSPTSLVTGSLRPTVDRQQLSWQPHRARGFKRALWCLAALHRPRVPIETSPSPWVAMGDTAIMSAGITQTRTLRQVRTTCPRRREPHPASCLETVQLTARLPPCNQARLTLCPCSPRRPGLTSCYKIS